MPSSTDHLSFQLESHELAEVDSEEQRLREEFVPLVLNNLSGIIVDRSSKRERSSTEAAAENERLRQFGISMIAAAGSIHDLDEKGVCQCQYFGPNIQFNNLHTIDPL